MKLNPGMIFNGLILGVYVLAIVRVIAKGPFGKPKTVRAEVIGKQTVESFSKYAGSGKEKAYYVTFLAGGKRRSFKVSAFSYNGYRVGESGTLTYKGDRLIDFS